MQRFILRQNIKQFQARLAVETDEATRLTIAKLLIETERKLALVASEVDGIEASHVPLEYRFSDQRERCLARVRDELLSSDKLFLLLDPGPGLRVLDASEAYAAATLTERRALRGRALFEVFPDNPGDPQANGVANLFASLRTAAETGRPHEMPVQRYDIRDASGAFVERHWRPVNTPLLDDEGRVFALLHRVDDVTAEIRSRPPLPSASKQDGAALDKG